MAIGPRRWVLFRRFPDWRLDVDEKASFPDQNTRARQLSVEDIRRTIEEGRAAGETSPAEEVFGHIEDKLRRLAG